MDKTKIKSILNRLLKAFVFGALGALGGLTIIMPRNWADMASVLGMITFACLSGGLTGIFMALQKWSSWVDEEVIS